MNRRTLFRGLAAAALGAVARCYVPSALAKVLPVRVPLIEQLLEARSRIPRHLRMTMRASPWFVCEAERRGLTSQELFDQLTERSP